jgi:hypothetical protein
LDGKLAASHGDLDVLISRSELELRLLQLGDLGFAAFTVNYEPRPGLPLVYGSTREELVLELSLLDIDPAGHPYFVVSTDNGPVSISMPRDLFQWAPTIIDGVPVHMLSPLALVHIRAGATSTGAFGPPRPERDGTRHSRLVDLFLSNVAPAQLEPTLTPISDRNSKALACASVPGVTPEARRKSNGACSARLGSG